MYYIFVENNELNGCGQAQCINDNIQNVEVTEEVFNNFCNDSVLYIWDGEKIIENPNYEEDKRAQRRQKLDQLTLTPADVERALYYSELHMDFDDLKAFIHEKMPTLDIKGLAIEFRAKDFYRGAKDKDGNRIIDIVGALLGYTVADMDYLFENGELPVKNKKTKE